jgi:hypothetical protein
MYCPLCAAEYRPGFTVCSDCQVDLVPERAQETLSDAASDSTPFVLVWSGNDLRKHAEICEALNRQEIPVRTLRRQDHLFGTSMHPDFEVLVPVDLREPAQEAVSQAEVTPHEDAGQLAESGGFEIPAEGDEPADDYEGDADRGESQNLDPEDATVEIWSGQDADMAAMIASSLRENRIIFRSDPNVNEPESASDEARTTKLFVFPEGEKRAKEIVREIVNAVPPE